MPKPKALSPVQARNTFVHRFGKRADRLRQIAVRFGVRPYRVFLVWKSWTGDEVGMGEEIELKRIEILPTPEVSDSGNYLFLPVGKTEDSVRRLSKVSPRLDEATLRGRYPGQDANECPRKPTTFYYVIREDNRSKGEVEEEWFTLSGAPFRLAGKLDWEITLERVEHQ